MILTSFTTGELKPHTKQPGGAHISTMALKNLYVITILASYFSSWETRNR